MESKGPRPRQFIAARVKRGRDDKGLSQEALAAKMTSHLDHGWIKQTVSLIERGRRDVSVDELLVLAIVLGKPIEWFLVAPQGLTFSDALSLDAKVLRRLIIGKEREVEQWNEEELLDLLEKIQRRLLAEARKNRTLRRQLLNEMEE